MDMGGSLRNVDRLSNLPEELISHIMSFLPMEDAVRTDVLSTKWRYKWTQMTHLEIHDYYMYSMKKSKKDQFLIFLERVLMLLGSQEIKSFSLECTKQYDASRVHTWIIALIRRQVKNLKIRCSTKGPLVFPLCSLDSKALKEINLSVICTLKIPTSFCFSTLKKLVLSEIIFQNMNFPDSRKVSINFLLLQELSLWRCSWEKVALVTIDAPVLTSFKFGDIEDEYVPKHARPFDSILKIQGSKLIKFNCGPHSSVCIRLPNGLSVTDATIELSSQQLNREFAMGYLTCSLLRKFSSPKSLTLSSETIVALSHLPNLKAQLPQFDSTLHLTISGGTPKLSEPLITLLLHLPCLESLTVNWGNPYPKDEAVGGFNKECLLPQLKLVRFLWTYGNNDEFELAKFILKNAESLVEITFIARGSQKERKRIMRSAKDELLNFPRASAQAFINIDEIAETFMS